MRHSRSNLSTMFAALKMKISESFFIKTEKSFLEEIKNVLFLENIFGCAFINDTNKLKVTDFILAIPFYLIFLYCIPLSIRFYQDILEDAVKIMYFSELVYFATNITVTVVRPIYFVAVRRFHYKILFEIEKMHFKITKGNYLGYKCNLDLLIFNSILLFNLFFYICEYNFTKINSQNLANHIVFFSGIWTAIINDFLTYSVLKHINKLFAILNGKLEAATVINPHQIDYNARRIRRYAYLHRKLTKICEDYNLLTSPSMIGCAAVGVTVVVLLMHYITLTLIAMFKRRQVDLVLMFFSLFWIGEIVLKVGCVIRMWLKVESQVELNLSYQDQDQERNNEIRF